MTSDVNLFEVVFPKKQLREESNKHHKARFDFQMLFEPSRQMSSRLANIAGLAARSHVGKQRDF